MRRRLSIGTSNLRSINMTTRPVFIASALVLAACAPQSSTSRDPETDRAAVSAAMDAYITAHRTNDAAAILGFWTSDGVAMFVGMPTIRGQVALDSLFRSYLAAMRITDFTVRTDETTVEGDLAVQLGTFSETLQPRQGAAQVVRGRFLFVWRRQADGTWKIARGMGTDATGL
jgi:uncharacterized protein (TIGR02246 family)